MDISPRAHARATSVPQPQADAQLPRPPAALTDLEAWAFCWQSLLKVSRTFSQPIALLPDELRAAVCCGYLLCRIADTVEDDAHLEPVRREALFRALLDVLEEGHPPHTFTRLADALEAVPAELELAQNLDQVLIVFRSLDPAMQQVCTSWCAELTRGMSIFVRRRPGDDGLVVLRTMPDLERYCYFVAGTVGQMLTELFLLEMPDIPAERAASMREYAEHFGLGLQLVNILKDQTDDLARNWCFVPQTLWQASGLGPRQMLDPACRGQAHAALEPLFARTRQYLRDALKFTLAIPADQPGMRLFCILPLWMAARTLRHAHRNDAMFTPEQPVKISRAEVADIIQQALASVSDDAGLRAQFSRLMST